jgi:TnpA family transposase
MKETIIRIQRIELVNFKNIQKGTIDLLSYRQIVYNNLQDILTRPINWELIRQQYGLIAKYAAALRLGTAETEEILKRSTRNNLKHPTYLALAELIFAFSIHTRCKACHFSEHGGKL